MHTITSTVKALDTTTELDTPSTEVTLYGDGYKAGWAAAVATLSISVDKDNKKVSASVGNSTYGSDSKSKTYSLSSSYSQDDYVDFGSYDYCYFYYKPVTDANGNVTSYTKRVYPYKTGKYYHVTGTSASITWT